MGRPLIDRLSDPARRHLMTSLFYAPSLGALAAAGGLAPAAFAATMFTTIAVYAYLRLKIEERDIQKIHESIPRHDPMAEHRRSAPIKVQRVCKKLCREFGVEKQVRVYLYPADYPVAFAAGDDEIGLSRKAYRLLSPGRLRWLIAHELGHIARGDTKVNQPMLGVSNCMEILAAGIGGASAIQAMGQTDLSSTAAAGLATAFAVAKARPYIDMYSSRSMERRRDYEATQKTGTPIDGMMAVMTVEALLERDKLTPHQRLLHTHPVGRARLMNIVTAYQDGVRKGIMPPIPAEEVPPAPAPAL